MDLAAMLKDLGLLGLVGIILNWVFCEQSKIRENYHTDVNAMREAHNSERDKWAGALATLMETMAKHNERAEAKHAQTMEEYRKLAGDHDRITTKLETLAVQK